MDSVAGSNKGQAENVLAAFRYQLLLSLDAWIGLGANEVLWLEIEEDFSVVSDDNAAHSQVKHSAATGGPKSRSLRSADVRAALSRYWTRSDQGRDSKSQLVFISNGGAAREQGLAFPGDAPGLRYWSAAARGADTGPIRSALATLFANEPIGQWIRGKPSDEELRARLLRRVSWALDSLEAGPLADQIHDKLAEIYWSKGLWVTLAKQSVHSLLGHVLETASAQQPGDRRLRAIDLHRTIESAAAPTAALQGAARMFSSAAADMEGSALFVNILSPPADNVAHRHATVQQILASAAGEPLIWLHGTHGIGKSTLARLIALELGGVWISLDLRSVQDDGRAALSAWRELLRELLRNSQVGGIIIDDLSGPARDALRTRLGALVTSLAHRGARVIVTSSHVASAALLAELGAQSNAAVQAPYLEEGDVRALVAGRDGPSEDMIEGWTQLIFMTTNGGHPLLVATKVSSLRSRNWPVSALLEDFGPAPSTAIQITRDEARRRLVDEIPSPEARQLLRRIGCVFDRADDGLVLKLAHGLPPIPNASDALAILRGSWIEVLPRDDLRLSPLIADIGHDVLEHDKLKWRQVAAEHWLNTRVLDERTLPLCFWNAFLGKHTWVLAKLCEVIQTLPPEKLRGAAALLSPMTLLVTDQSIYPEVPAVAVMLRLLQFEIADAMEDNDTADRVVRRLFAEIDEIEHEELRLLEISIAVPKILLAEKANIPPAFQLECALRLREAQKRISTTDLPEMKDLTESITRSLPSGLDMAGFLFATIVTRIRSSERMLAMIEALDGLKEGDRNSLIDSPAIILGGNAGDFVHNGWGQEQLDGINLQPALERFTRMTKIARRWGRPELQIELVCAQSIILDEGLDEKANAIAIIDEAINEFGEASALVRQKAKVLKHTGDHQRSAQLLMSVEDVVAIDVPFDRALALRDGGISAARAEMFPDAIRLFRKAHEVLLSEGKHFALAVGIQIDIALTLWVMKDSAGAMAALAGALDAVEALDPTDSRQNERAHHFARAAIGRFWHELEAYPSRSHPEIPIGEASNLAGEGALLGIDLKSLADNWRIFALCEIEMGIDAGIEQRSLAKQDGPGLVSIEMLIIAARYTRAVANAELTLAFRRGIQAVSATKTALQLGSTEANISRATPDQLEAKTLSVLLVEDIEAIQRIPIDLLIQHVLGNNWDPDFLSQLEAACVDAWGDSGPISEILRAASGVRISSTSQAISLAALLSPAFDPRGNPRVRFLRDQLLVHHTAISPARHALETLVVSEIMSGWNHVVLDELFALRLPFLYVPAMEEALADMNVSGLRGAARLLLAAAPAVNVSLGDDWVGLLEKLSSG